MKKVKTFDYNNGELIETRIVSECGKCWYIFEYSSDKGFCNCLEKNVKVDMIDDDCYFEDVMEEEL